MVHLRIVGPGRAEKVLDLLEAARRLNLVDLAVRRAASGDVVLCDVAREDAA